VWARARLSLEEIKVLLNLSDPSRLREMFRLAARVKNEIYGERLVFFAPLYLSNYCVNDCAYCGFQSRQLNLSRRKLTPAEVEAQTRILLAMGHKRVLLECGEDPINNSIDYVVAAMERIYQAGIRRINVNIAATTVENYSKLKKADIGTYQLFQETYHRPTYEKLHRGPKADYDRQLAAPERAFEAGLDDYGLGVLFGLYDYKFEVLSLISHARQLEKKLGVGPHTISVPRFRPAAGVTYRPEYPVSDTDFLKIIAVLRLALPYTGLILSTRESPEIRAKAFEIGISQASAASSTSPGGYRRKERKQWTVDSKQFEVYDERSLAEVIGSVLEQGFLPSFCTACYRRGRTGEKFMELARPGEIHEFCRPNGLLTFAEYLEDYGRNGLYASGYRIINRYLAEIKNETTRRQTQERLRRIEAGERDLYF
jgi:2-iminoacetate synthase